MIIRNNSPQMLQYIDGTKTESELNGFAYRTLKHMYEDNFLDIDKCRKNLENGKEQYESEIS